VSDSHYWELRVPAPVEISEGLTNFLWEQGALGVVEESVGDALPTLRGFFPSAVAPAALDARVRTYLDALRALGFHVGDEPTLTRLADENWALAWREHFRPLSVGARLRVAPSWDVPPPDGRITIVLDPGRAFGTGHHGTTRGCLEAIESIVDRRPPAAALDLGTGSGILAIAMALLGVPWVHAVDDDPEAIAAAMENVDRHGLGARITCAIADAATLDNAPAPLVVANLLTAAHRRLAPTYARRVARAGSLVLGGILDAEAAEVRAAVDAHGFVSRDTRSLEGWTTLVLERA
jgi:ribosomal protein L11 methyltransferase